MKGHTDTYLSLNEIANAALLDLGESSHRKEQFLQWAIRYYKRYRMDMAREVVTKQVKLTPWKSIILPNDTVDWLAVGIHDGLVLKTFVNSGRDITPRDCACDEDAPATTTYSNIDYGDEGFTFWGCSPYGEDPGKMFGLMLKDNGLGYFTPNYNQRVNEIQLNSTKVSSTDKIFLMYLSTLFDPAYDAVVHPYAEEMINKGIHFENLKHKQAAGDRRITGDMVALAMKERDDEICLLAERRWDLSVETIIEVARSGNRQTPKR